jgi:hypothetical protein
MHTPFCSLAIAAAKSNPEAAQIHNTLSHGVLQVSSVMQQQQQQLAAAAAAAAAQREWAAAMVQQHKGGKLNAAEVKCIA